MDAYVICLGTPAAGRKMGALARYEKTMHA
jgi:hypothetical protein